MRFLGHARRVRKLESQWTWDLISYLNVIQRSRSEPEIPLLPGIIPCLGDIETRRIRLRHHARLRCHWVSEDHEHMVECIAATHLFSHVSMDSHDRMSPQPGAFCC